MEFHNTFWRSNREKFWSLHLSSQFRRQPNYNTTSIVEGINSLVLLIEKPLIRCTKYSINIKAQVKQTIVLFRTSIYPGIYQLLTAFQYELVNVGHKSCRFDAGTFKFLWTQRSKFIVWFLPFYGGHKYDLSTTIYKKDKFLIPIFAISS